MASVSSNIHFSRHELRVLKVEEMLMVRTYVPAMQVEHSLHHLAEVLHVLADALACTVVIFQQAVVTQSLKHDVGSDLWQESECGWVIEAASICSHKEVTNVNAQGSHNRTQTHQVR